MNKRRKEKLAKEAVQYGKRKHSDKILTVMWAAADGFEDGYRAAMQDARKVLAEAEARFRASGHKGQQPLRRTMLLNAISRFLLPLR
jgi:hypothetical protein